MNKFGINTEDKFFIDALELVESQLKTKVMTDEEITALRSPNFYVYKNCNQRD